MTREEQAKKCLVALVGHVLSHENQIPAGITYQDLALQIGLLNKHGDPHPRLGAALGFMGHFLESAQPHFREEIPHIQALVVTKNGPNQGLPDDGIREFWDGYDLLGRNEKENKAHAEWRRIGDFGSRWLMVLDHLGLEATEAARVFPSRPPTKRGKGGESVAHKALKAFVKANPSIVGVAPTAEAFEEYALPSLDTLDVLFKEPLVWTAVEVKSSVSDGTEGDYERGLYQTVKYSALLQAMRHDEAYAVPDSIRVVLVLENSLPKALLPLQAALNAQVIDQIKPTSHVESQ